MTDGLLNYTYDVGKVLQFTPPILPGLYTAYATAYYPGGESAPSNTIQFQKLGPPGKVYNNRVISIKGHH